MTAIVPPRIDAAYRNAPETGSVARSVRTPGTGPVGARSTGGESIGTTGAESTGGGATARAVATYSWFGARIGMGVIFLWAFVDKLFGMGYATPDAKGWIDGGNPTKGFLSGAEGPFAGLYHDLAGTAFANLAFMVGLAAIGVALLLGIGMRIAAAAGALMLTMMYTVVLPPETNPVIDDHLVLAVLLIGIAAAGAGATFGLGRWWTSTRLVKRLPWLT
ncbi:DoxX family membrane protein [Plantactinospora sp. S1510]|uniref:DoxX family membrane protein n=1 Tax=Plantactinospora alkalitolerans TaxID=2789879 RepID=A0ABS0GZ14_9ACTN|nr:DoxX family membrane protein [Plantactinospora alkalitolerans]MBF9131311.1 DoxX family membrane protein [Plantactinospora alkalitolerans]